MHSGARATNPAPRVQRIATPAAFTGAVLGALLIGSLGSLDIASIAHASGVTSGFRALHPATFIDVIAVAVLTGAAGWQFIRQRSNHPESLLAKLVPAVVVLSFAPDVLLHVIGVAHATWGAVTTLMAIDVFVGLAAVTSYRLLLPVRRSPGTGSGITWTVPSDGWEHLLREGGADAQSVKPRRPVGPHAAGNEEAVPIR